MKYTGITTTIPVDIIYASGRTCIDLNNSFISSKNPERFIMTAEDENFPRNTCSWIKGIYAYLIKNKNIKEIIGVYYGDCSSNCSMLDALKLMGKKIIPFSYSPEKDRNFMYEEINKLITELRTNINKVYKTKKELDKIRKKVFEIDKLTWQDDLVHGLENHIFNVSCSDFQSSPEVFDRKISEFLKNANKRKKFKQKIRLGYIGVPPINSEIYNFVESKNARIVYNEVQRQFAMPDIIEDIVEQYLVYTYPYGIFERLKDIEKEIKKRKIDALIHYTQSFCHHQIEDIIIRKKIKIPVLNVEIDKPGSLDARTKLRVESFLEMLQ